MTWDIFDPLSLKMSTTKIVCPWNVGNDAWNQAVSLQNTEYLELDSSKCKIQFFSYHKVYWAGLGAMVCWKYVSSSTLRRHHHLTFVFLYALQKPLAKYDSTDMIRDIDFRNQVASCFSVGLVWVMSRYEVVLSWNKPVIFESRILMNRPTCIRSQIFKFLIQYLADSGQLRWHWFQHSSAGLMDSISCAKGLKST